MCLRWLVQHGITVIPKSTSEAHLRENLDIFNWELTPEDMKAIDSIGIERRRVSPIFNRSPFFRKVVTALA